MVATGSARFAERPRLTNPSGSGITGSLCSAWYSQSGRRASSSSRRSNPGKPLLHLGALLGRDRHAGPERQGAEVPLQGARESHLGEVALPFVVVELAPDHDRKLLSGHFLRLADEIGDQVGRPAGGLEVIHARAVHFDRTEEPCFESDLEAQRRSVRPLQHARERGPEDRRRAREGRRAVAGAPRADRGTGDGASPEQDAERRRARRAR